MLAVGDSYRRKSVVSLLVKSMGEELVTEGVSIDGISDGNIVVKL